MIPISTNPENTKINVFDRRGNEIISTQSPDSLHLNASAGYFKRAEYLIEVSKKGYETKKEILYFVMDGKYLQNVFLSFFMPVGFLLIDPVSGAMWMPEKHEIEFTLNPDVKK